MNLRDVDYFCIADSNNTVLYEQNYKNVSSTHLLASTNDAISLYNDRVLFLSTKYSMMNTSLKVALLASKDANEIFVEGAFNALVEVMDGVIKNWSVERVQLKYDILVYLTNEFVFNGIILEDTADALQKRLQKRTFESVAGMKVNKGLASMLNRAAKSVKNGFK